MTQHTPGPSYDGYLFGEDIGLVVYGRRGHERFTLGTIPTAEMPVTGSLNDVALGYARALLAKIEGK